MGCAVQWRKEKRGACGIVVEGGDFKQSEEREATGMLMGRDRDKRHKMYT